MADRAQMIAQLKDRASAKRRSAAKHLRRLADPSAGTALLELRRDHRRVNTTLGTRYEALDRC
jgi:hypothetical protein